MKDSLSSRSNQTRLIWFSNKHTCSLNSNKRALTIDKAFLFVSSLISRVSSPLFSRWKTVGLGEWKKNEARETKEQSVPYTKITHRQTAGFNSASMTTMVNRVQSLYNLSESQSQHLSVGQLMRVPQLVDDVFSVKMYPVPGTGTLYKYQLWTIS